MATRILITGASGFIGSFLVDAALQKGYEVVAGVRRGSPRTYLKDPRVSILELDYASVPRLTEQLKQASCPVVIHNAGSTGTKGEADFQRVNVVYTRNLVSALAAGPPPERFLYISTLAVMGPGDAATMSPLKIGDPERPVTAYAKSKRDGEQIILGAPFPFTIIRPTAVYGPRDRDFLELFKWIRRGVSPQLAPARQQLSFVYVKDLAEATIDLISTPAPAPVYLASDGNSYNRDAFGRTIAEALGQSYRSLGLPRALMMPALAVAGHVQGWFGRYPFLTAEKVLEMTAKNWQCDSSALWRTIGRSPRYDLKAGITETLAWYRSEGWL